MDRKATLIILAWNRWALTEQCIRTLLTTELDDVDVIVVDNGSTDETPERLAEIPEIRVITLPENLGFVRGNNAGIAAADPASDVVLLNNDLVFTQKDWLTRLRRCLADHSTAGVVGCRLTFPDGRLLHAGTYILPDDLVGQQIGSLQRDVGQFGGDRRVQGIVFACALIRREVLDAIGPLSLDYRSYFEDTDFCLRADEAGFATLVCGDVTLVHDEHGSTGGDRSALLAMLDESRATFARSWRAHLEAHYRHRLLWQSIMNFPTGYAASCRHHLLALEEAGVRCAYRYAYGPGTVFPVPEPEQAGDHRLNLIRNREVTARDRRIGVLYGQGDVFERNRGRYKVGYTMLEVDGFPDEWVRQANLMDEIWVPTKFNRQGFLASGLKRPIHVVPLGVDTDYFSPAIHRFPNPDGDFVFLASFEWGERKEPWMLMKVFNETFRASDPVRLVCKIMNKDPGVNLQSEIRRLGLRPGGGRLAFLINLEFPYDQLGALYRSADCFVAAVRGEGWDMPLMEAMACGLPTIATDWGAHQEFIHEGICYPLRIRGTIPARAKCPYYAGFSWADPDPEHLRFLLREIYENREEAELRGRAAAAEMATRWSWQRAAAKIVARLEAIDEASGSQPAQASSAL